ncbi:MAG: hypothetical protein J6V71_00350 [Clostridia bacterium]|nr:hypothetical protein [Clostridia bacterium]
MLSRAEKKQRALEAAEAAKAEAEYNAKYAAKQERKKVEKMVAEFDKSISSLMEKAANAKVKGYEEIYRQCLMFIKIAKGRKKQAETFLFQMDAMQEMASISKSSTQMLSSMNNIMESLGKISLDKSVMHETQASFRKAEQGLNKQSMAIDQFLGGMEMSFSDEGMESEADIENEIGNYISEKKIDSASVDASSGQSDDMSYYQQLLQS